MMFSPGGDYPTGIPHISFKFESAKLVKFVPSTPEASITLEALVRCSRSSSSGVLVDMLKKSSLIPKATKESTTSPITTKADEFQTSEINFLSLPFGIIMYLFAPIFSSELSLSTILGIAESILWVPLYVIFFKSVLSYRRAMTITHPTIRSILIFVICLVTFSGFFEVNYGTALRHRSLLLIPILAGIMLIRAELNRKKL
jgi:hypothetical protein